MAGSPARSPPAPLLSMFITQRIDCLRFNPCYGPLGAKGSLLPLALEGGCCGGCELFLTPGHLGKGFFWPLVCVVAVLRNQLRLVCAL